MCYVKFRAIHWVSAELRFLKSKVLTLSSVSPNKLGNYCNAFDELINASCLFSVQRKVTSFTQSENINVAHSPLEEICNEGKDSLWSKGES